MVVNNHPVQADLLSGLLRKAGVEPRAFTGAEAALAALSAGAGTAGNGSSAVPSLIVTELYMPGIDGWRFCRLLRSPEYAAFNKVPILVVSGTFVGDEASRIAADLGAEAFLASPVDAQRFGEQVRAILSGEPVRIPLRVLIVDDNAPLCDLLEVAFADHGYQAETALTIQAAVEAFGKAAYDVAVLDYHLPDGQGDALLDAFRAQRPDCVCLMMTSDTGPDLALEWMKRGAAAYLQKPFRTDYLIELCARARRERALLRVQDLLEARTRELRESEEKYRILLEESPDPIFSFTPEGRYKYLNQAFAKGVGKRVEDIIGKTIWDVFPKEEAEKRFAPLSDVFRTGNGKVIEVRVPRPSGDRYYVTTITPIRDAAGTVVSAICSSKDITERKQAEAEKERLDAQNRQLQKSESLGRMAGAIAHHFNNQLHAVMMNLEMAMQDPLGDEGPVENLAEAMHSARKAAEVSSLMLTYLGQTQCRREPLDLSEICLRSLPMLRAAIPKDVVLETDVRTPGPAIGGNSNQIQQVLTNLATNAWESSGGGRGVVRLAVKTVSAADIAAVNRFPIDSQPRDTAYACLEVADAGCGIPEKDIERLFDPFFSSKFTGRGLGLAVVLGIVRAHSGTITVESKPGRGSVFRVFFPVSPEPVPREPVQLTQAPRTACDRTLLVVEDEPAVRKAVTFALKRYGFTVLTAQDGIEAVEKFRQHRDEIGCVLCDLTMPHMSGWETLTAVRKLAPGIPVILSSGYSEAQAMEGDHSELPQAFFSKPYEFKTLANTISQLLANRAG